MTVVTIPKQEKFLLDLFMKIPDEGLILQTIDGQSFMLSSLEGWQSFNVGPSDDFEQEVRATSENQELATFLAQRRSDEGRVSLEDVKSELGLD